MNICFNSLMNFEHAYIEHITYGNHGNSYVHHMLEQTILVLTKPMSFHVYINKLFN